MSSYTDPDKFKILCKETIGFSCFPYFRFPIFSKNGVFISEPYPLVTPNIYNATGEYYFDIGSHITVQCTHPSLCSVNCTNGGCDKSHVNCGDSNKCMVLCTDSWSVSCQYLDIMADDINQFNLECTSPGGA
eukprot:359951_1